MLSSAHRPAAVPPAFWKTVDGAIIGMVIIPVHSHQWGSQETHRERKQFGEEQAKVTDERISPLGNY